MMLSLTAACGDDTDTDVTGGSTDGSSPDASATDEMRLTISGGELTTPVEITVPLGENSAQVSDSIAFVFLPSEPVPSTTGPFPRLDRFTFEIGGITPGQYPLLDGTPTTYQFDIDFADTDGLDAFSLRPAAGTLTIQALGNGELTGNFSSAASPTQMDSTDVQYQIAGEFTATYRE
jgi:hypothetical protein